MACPSGGQLWYLNWKCAISDDGITEQIKLDLQLSKLYICLAEKSVSVSASVSVCASLFALMMKMFCEFSAQMDIPAINHRAGTKEYSSSLAGTQRLPKRFASSSARTRQIRGLASRMINYTSGTLCRTQGPPCQ